MYYVTKIDDEAFGEDAVTFVTLNALYQTLGTSDTKETILLSKYARAYASAIAAKYPSATVENYDVPE